MNTLMFPLYPITGNLLFICLQGYYIPVWPLSLQPQSASVHIPQVCWNWCCWLVDSCPFATGGGSPHLSGISTHHVSIWRGVRRFCCTCRSMCRQPMGSPGSWPCSRLGARSAPPVLHLKKRYLDQVYLPILRPIWYLYLVKCWLNMYVTTLKKQV